MFAQWQARGVKCAHDVGPLFYLRELCLVCRDVEGLLSERCLPVELMHSEEMRPAEAAQQVMTAHISVLKFASRDWLLVNACRTCVGKEA